MTGHYLTMISTKRGQETPLAIMVFGVCSITMAIIIILGFKLSDDISTNFQDSGVISDTGKAYVKDFNDSYATIFDGIFVMAVVLLAVLVIVSGFLIDTHPIMMAVMVPLFLATLLVNAIMANVLDEFGSTSVLASLYVQLPMMNFLGSHWLEVIISVTFLTFVVSYTRTVNP